jgi:hypothetical protein
MFGFKMILIGLYLLEQFHALIFDSSARRTFQASDVSPSFIDRFAIEVVRIPFPTARTASYICGTVFGLPFPMGDPRTWFIELMKIVEGFFGSREHVGTIIGLVALNGIILPCIDRPLPFAPFVITVMSKLKDIPVVQFSLVVFVESTMIGDFVVGAVFHVFEFDVAHFLDLLFWLVKL